MERRDYERAVATGVLRDYTDIAFDGRDNLNEVLLFSQLILEEDPSLRSRLLADISSLSNGEVAVLASREAALGDTDALTLCEQVLSERMRNGKHKTHESSFADWRDSLRPCFLTTTLALANVSDIAISIANQNRDTGLVVDILRLFAGSLRAHTKVAEMRELMLKSCDMLPEEQNAVFADGVFLCIEEQVNADKIISLVTSPNAYCTIYRSLRGIEQPNLELVPIAVVEQRNKFDIDIFEYERKLGYLLYDSFFELTANYVNGHVHAARDWLASAEVSEWGKQFLKSFARISFDLASGIRLRSLRIVQRFLEGLAELPKVTASETRDTDTNKLVNGARAAMVTIALEVWTIGQKLNAEGTDDQLQELVASRWIDPEIFAEIYLRRARRQFSDESIARLLARQTDSIENSVDVFRTRALRFARWAAVAAMHEQLGTAHVLVRTAASNMVAYGYHKDMLFFAVIEVMRRLHSAGLIDGRDWIVKLAAPIAYVDEYTDGDHTRYLPQELGEAVVEIAPELTPRYYHWLTDQEEYFVAEKVMHAFLTSADLTDYASWAVASTALDGESLRILKDRSDRGDEAALHCLENINMEIGFTVPLPRPDPYASPQRSTAGIVAEEKCQPQPADFPPDRLGAWIDANDIRFSDFENKIREWIKHWEAADMAEDVVKALCQADARGLQLGDYDAVFDLVKSVHGKEAAFRWLVKANRDRAGWMSFGYDKKEAQHRWEQIKAHYPNRWHLFLIDSLFRYSGGPEERFVVSPQYVSRIVEYFLFLGKTDAALGAGTALLSISIELVAPLQLDTPVWAHLQ
jgi:hypothetical protein